MSQVDKKHTNFIKFNRINTFCQKVEHDWRAKSFKVDFRNTIKTRKKSLQTKHQGLDNTLSLENIRTLKSYFLSFDYTELQLKEIASNLLVDPILESFSINQLVSHEINLDEFDYLVEIGFESGVVDNEARTFNSALKDYLKQSYQDTQTSSGYLYLLKFNKKLELEKIKTLFESFLVNPLIERLEVIEIFSSNISNNNSLLNEKRSIFPNFFSTGIVDNIKTNNFYEVMPISNLKTEEEILKFSSQKLLHFNLAEMDVIRKYFSSLEVRGKRKQLGLPNDPSDVELEVLAQTWSEHCKHKIFAARIDYYEDGKFKETINSLYKTYIKQVTHEIKKTNKNLLSVFSDNSGVFKFDKNKAICMKVETHNSPSALDPFGGAITGIVGVNRDIIGTGIGAQPLFNTNVFCFAKPHFDEEKVPKKLFHPSRVFKGVHHGVERGGNESGIPTVNGAMVFDDRFLGKPLVFCGTGGIIPLKIGEVDAIEKSIHKGDLIVMVGGRIGKDGIHGATFSSVGLDESSPNSVVQIGDPITQKKMLDFIIKARDNNLYRTLTDNGAGGLSSSVGELATLTNGCEIHLDQALLKYQGLKPWEILVSESQERMTLSVPPEKRIELIKLAKLYDVEICFLGTFNDSGNFTAFYKNQIVAHLSMDFLHNGVPQLQLKAEWTPPQNKARQKIIELKLEDFNAILKTILARPNVASKENWVRQYDHEVKAKTILKPFDGVHRDAPMDAAVIKPDFESQKGLVISNGLMPRYSDIDTYHMARASIDEAVRNLVCVGGNPLTMYGLDNFCWPDPIADKNNLNGEYKLAQLVRANKGIYDLCSEYQLPLISGKDSMKNDYGYGDEKISVPPTLLFTVLSVIDDYSLICSSSFKQKEGVIYFLGNLQAELGGSEYYAHLGIIGNRVPTVNAKANFSLYQGIYQLITKCIICACHDLSDGGLVVSLAESCFGGDCGALIDLSVHFKELSSEEKLFSESQGCFVVEVVKKKKNEFEKIIKKYSSHYYEIGKTQIKKSLEIIDKNMQKNKSSSLKIIEADIDTLKTAWKTGLDF